MQCTFTPPILPSREFDLSSLLYRQQTDEIPILTYFGDGKNYLKKHIELLLKEIASEDPVGRKAAISHLSLLDVRGTKKVLRDYMISFALHSNMNDRSLLQLKPTLENFIELAKHL